MANAVPLLEVRQVGKHFPGVQALDGVSLTIRAGEVLAIVGENGAGKSTLMKILAGIYSPDAGDILLDGQAVHFRGTADALTRGIVLIHQELNLAENLSVRANLFLGREPVWGGWLGWLEAKRERQVSVGLLQRVGLEVSPDQQVGTLSPGQRQLVEVARALSLDARLIIMDEPTSSLTQRETDRLYQVIADLKCHGVAVVYISHRLGEVRRVADRVEVLRDGRNAGHLRRDEVSHDALVHLMVGRELKQIYPGEHGRAVTGLVRLEVRGLTFAGGPDEPLSFGVHAGEIVGLAGLVGGGTELAEALFGLRAIRTGEVFLDGQRLLKHTPKEMIRAGVLLVPEDRRRHGLVLPFSIRLNLALPNLDAMSRLGFLRMGREKLLVRGLMEKLRVRALGPGQVVGLLSGGNQQKVVLGKWLARRPKVLILDEPTRGVDVGARGEIYGLMDQLAGEGVAILMISSDMEEVLGMSNRVLVLHQGRLAGELAGEDLGEEAVMRLATGATR